MLWHESGLQIYQMVVSALSHTFQPLRIIIGYRALQPVQS